MPLGCGKPQQAKSPKTKLEASTVRTQNTARGENKKTVILNTSTLGNGLVAHYLFNGNAKDESGNGHNGKVFGARLVADRHKNDGKAYNFDGTDDYINLGNDDDFNFGKSDFSLSLWFQTSVNQPSIYLIGKYNDLLRPAYGVGTGFVTDAYAFVAETSSVAEVRGNVNLANGVWRHLTAVCDRDTWLTVYVDGLIVGSVDAISESGAISSEANLIIGAIESGQYFSGKIDDVRIYNRALFDDEVKALYDLEKPKGG